MPKIVDIIITKHPQTFLVLDKLPKFEYVPHHVKPDILRRSLWLHAENNGFFDQYYYEKPAGPKWKAFAGREFYIPLKGGGSIHATGQWWSGTNRDLISIETCSPGYSTIEDLKKCFVFYGGIKVDKRCIDNWLSQNEPVNDYNEYRRQLND